jgi:hypothetical protein
MPCAMPDLNDPAVRSLSVSALALAMAILERSAASGGPA